MEGKSYDFFPIDTGVVKGCTLSPTLFLIYFNGLLSEMRNARRWVFNLLKIEYLVFCLPIIL